MLFLITYTGLIRFKKPDLTTRVPQLFSLSFEVFAHALPLIMIQVYNNKFLDKFDRPLDSLNLTLSVLNLTAILSEVLLTYYISHLRKSIGVNDDQL